MNGEFDILISLATVNKEAGLESILKEIHYIDLDWIQSEDVDFDGLEGILCQIKNHYESISEPIIITPTVSGAYLEKILGEVQNIDMDWVQSEDVDFDGLEGILSRLKNYYKQFLETA